MSKLRCRSSIALAAVAGALLWSKPADAQVGAGSRGEPVGLLNNLASGAQYDIVNRAKAERQLEHRLARLGRDGEQGRAAAVGRDVRRIDNLRFRIAVDGWLIRQNSLQDPGYYPYPVRLDPMSCAAIAQAARPPQAP